MLSISFICKGRARKTVVLVATLLVYEHFVLIVLVAEMGLYWPTRLSYSGLLLIHTPTPKWDMGITWRRRVHLRLRTILDIDCRQLTVKI
jgi:hypothetical protein